MKKSTLSCIAASIALAGCTSNLNSALGTTKNPFPVLAMPPGHSQGGGRNEPENRINAFVRSNYDILLSATQAPSGSVDPVQMQRYLTAGFALSDYYCEEFFRDADESQRRRRFARGAVNDAGTAITAILGLANAGQDLVTATATGFGLADNLWRNYDDAFVVDANLSHVRNLVLAASDNFRERTLGRSGEQPLPTEYGTAQTIILRYANLCSTLGMQSLLNEAASQQRAQLNRSTEERRSPQADRTEGSPPASQPISATPPITTTRGRAANGAGATPQRER